MPSKMYKSASNKNSSSAAAKAKEDAKKGTAVKKVHVYKGKEYPSAAAVKAAAEKERATQGNVGQERAKGKKNVAAMRAKHGEAPSYLKKRFGK